MDDEGDDWARKGTNQIWLGFLLTMLAAMRDASEVCSIPDILASLPLNPMIFSPQAIPKDSEDYLTYESFCKQVAEKLSHRPRILGHDRIRSSVHFGWLQSLQDVKVPPPEE